MTLPLSLLFGAAVGFALGLTGGGGSLLAVPLLVYGLGIPARDAFGISLAAVGATALFGVVSRWSQGRVEVGTGAWFAVAGMVGAPLGTILAAHVPEHTLLLAFGALMLVVAVKMWRGAGQTADPTRCDDRKACQRTSDGRLRLSSRCAMLLAVVGLMTGILSGLFGVGGGFVIVPALVFFSGMSIHRAVGTSLLVIVLVSISGVTSHFVAGRGIPLALTSLFVAGGMAGMWLGGIASKRLSGERLQRIFSGGIVAVAGFILLRSIG